MTLYHPSYSLRVNLGNNPDCRVKIVARLEPLHQFTSATSPLRPGALWVLPRPHLPYSVFESVLRIKSKMHSHLPKRTANDKQA